MAAPEISRRDWLRLAAAGVLGGSVSGWMGRLAAAAPPLRGKVRSCILLWMNGGPSTIDLWDLKVGHANGGPFKEIATKSPGLKFGEHLPRVAKFSDRMAVVRSMTTKEGDHGRATYYLRTGYFPQASVAYPTIGSFISKELGEKDFPLPRFVSVAPYRFFNQAAFAPGLLGPMHAPLIVGEALQFGARPGTAGYTEALKVLDIEPPKRLEASEVTSREGLLADLDKDFATTRPDTPARSHKAAYERALRLMKTEARKAFNLDEEKASVRDAYGRNLFGQGCLLARRLVERGVPFVEVNHGGAMPGGFGWDTHSNNFDLVKNNCETLDPAWAMLMADLKDRGLLDSTLIIWMGEFGRTPKINGGRGRDHYPNAWSAVLAGAHIKGGQAYGKTSADGSTVEKDPVTVPDLMATIVKALGIDVEKANMFSGRPIRLVDRGGKPVTAITG